MAGAAKAGNEAKITVRISHHFIAPLSINEAIYEKQLRLHRFHLDLRLNQRGLIRNKTLRI